MRTRNASGLIAASLALLAACSSETRADVTSPDANVLDVSALDVSDSARAEVATTADAAQSDVSNTDGGTSPLRMVTVPAGVFEMGDHSGLGGEDPRHPSDADGANPLGLYDLSGNAWEWVNDWYGREYYLHSPEANPPGSTRAEASPMPDGLPYRVMRGGSWFNGEPDGHSRVSNRDPSYFRGPGDPAGPWFHVGIRVVLARPQS